MNRAANHRALAAPWVSGSPRCPESSGPRAGNWEWRRTWQRVFTGGERTGDVASLAPLGRTALSTQKKQRYSLNSDRTTSDSLSNPKVWLKC